jgi:hypothetical protein
MPETKIRIMDWVNTPNGLGQVAEFDKNGQGETIVKVYHHGDSSGRWYKLTEINL